MIYLDNAATTKVREEVLNAMLPYFCEEYGNPSGVYSLSRSAHSALDGARQQVARAIGARFAREIYFTSCGSESDNWAIFSSVLFGDKKHIVTSLTEHHAVLNCLAAAEKLGASVTYLTPDKHGAVTAAQVKNAIRSDTALVTVMTANNEVGTINPISEIGAVCRNAGVLFHTDAVQAVGHINIDVNKMNVDMLSLSGHKFHAPKGVGALYVRNGVKLSPFINGGSQERGKRAGTENLASIVGLGKAIELAASELDEHGKRTAALRDHLQKRLISENSGIYINGDPDNRLPGILNIAIEGVRSDAFIFNMDSMGIACSSGSACAAGSAEPSQVLLSMKIRKDLQRSVVRFSLSRFNTLDEINYAADCAHSVISKLRKSRY